MSTDWLKRVNDTPKNIKLMGDVLLNDFIAPWLGKNIIDAFFKADAEKSWDYIYRQDIAEKAGNQQHRMICPIKLPQFLGNTNLISICNAYRQLPEPNRQNASPSDLGITSVIPLDSAKLDIPAMAKILRRRIHTPNNGALNNWADKIINLRNVTDGHKDQSTALEWTDKKFTDNLDELIVLTHNAKLSADSEWPDFGGGLSGIFQILEDELLELSAAYKKVTEGIFLSMDYGNHYQAEDLFTYKVLFTFVDTSSDYTQRFIQSLHDWYDHEKRHHNFYTDSITIDRLANESKSNHYAKSLLKEFTTQLEKGSLVPLNTELSTLSLTDLIIENLCCAKGKWCVITGSEQLAKDIYGMKNPDIVVTRVADSKTLVPYIMETIQFTFSFDTAENPETDENPKDNASHEESAESDNLSAENSAHICAQLPEESDSADHKASSAENEDADYEAVTEAEFQVNLTTDPENTDTETNPHSSHPVTTSSGTSAATPSKKKKPLKEMPKQGGIVFNESSPYPQTLYREISKGGEGIIYDTGMGYKYIKLYHDNVWSIQRANKITAMRAFAPNLPETICWPLEAVFHPDRSPEPIGYEMLNVKSKSPDAIALDELLYDLSYENPWKWSRSDLVNLCSNIARNLKALHENNIIMGDVNPKNILVDQKGKVWFIDTDSYQFTFDSKTYRCEVGTPEFSSPNLYRKKCKYREVDRTLDDENFATACLFFQILFLGESPFPTEAKSIRNSIIYHKFRLYGNRARRHNYKWGNLTEAIQKVFENTFLQGIYVDESEWIKLLTDMETAISDGKLSDMLDPTSAPMPGIEVKRVYLECNQCGEEFEFFDNNKSNPDDHFCPSCKKSRNLLRTKIIRLRCKDCGAIFTVNKWDMVRRFWSDDLDEFDTDNALCPDCDKRMCVPNEKKLTDDNTEIERAMQNAYKNSKPQWEMLMYGETES